MPIDLSHELIVLRRQILTMGAAVEQRVRDAVNALLNRNAELAQQVRRSDGEINSMEIDIEEECLKILALTQPVAGDLRFVLAVMRINQNFERIGDLAKSIAKRTLDLLEQGYVDIPNPIEHMCREAQHMLENVLTSLSDQNVELARRVRAADDRVDDLQREVFVWARNEIPSHVEHTEAAIDFLSIARKLERVGDMSTNIAEEVIFLSEGTLVRHQRT